MTLLLTSLMTLELILMQKDDAVAAFEPGQAKIESPDGPFTLNYRLLKPLKIESGRKYPVVLFLHGAGERGVDNQKQLLYFPERMAQPEQRERYPCFVIAPQCPDGRRWVEVDWTDRESTPQGPATPQVTAAIAVLEQVLQQHPCDRHRVYLTGLSMGGYGVWDIALRRPELFAAVAPICAGGDEAQAARLARVPVWAIHGDADKVVPVERSRRMIEALRAAGGQPKYTELPGVGHNSWNPAYQDPQGLTPWMFQQVRQAD